MNLGITAGVVFALFAFLASIVFFISNRLYAKSLFETTQYPDIDFYLEVLTSWKAIQDDKIVWDETYLPHLTFIRVNWNNNTKVEAINLHAIIVLTTGFKRIEWREDVNSGTKIEPLQSGKTIIGTKIIRALHKLCPKFFILKKEDSANVLDEWLEVHNTEKLPNIGLNVEFLWQPPLWRGKLLKKQFRSILKPQMIESGRIDLWIAVPISSLIPMRIARWRPRTIHI